MNPRIKTKNQQKKKNQQKQKQTNRGDGVAIYPPDNKIKREARRELNWSNRWLPPAHPGGIKVALKLHFTTSTTNNNKQQQTTTTTATPPTTTNPNGDIPTDKSTRNRHQLKLGDRSRLLQLEFDFMPWMDADADAADAADDEAGDDENCPAATPHRLNCTIQSN